LPAIGTAEGGVVEDMRGEEEEEDKGALTEADLPDLVVNPASAKTLLSSCKVGGEKSRKVCM